MIKKENPRLRNTVLGALVADAASVGLHWIYDQARIREIAPESPEFRTPDKADYEGVLSFYAHGNKQAGDFSHYGEQVMVMLRALAGNSGRYDKSLYQEHFCAHFGYGGDYVGYIDHPTRDTLDNITKTESDALKCAKMIPFDGDEKNKNEIISRVLEIAKKTSGEALRAQVQEAVLVINSDLEEYAFKVMDELEVVGSHQGADDVQLPAISKLPALVAAYAGDNNLQEVAESAVRVTNNNDLSAAFGRVSASMMEAVILGETPQSAIDSGIENADENVADLFGQALSLKDESTLEVTSRFGASCNLVFGVPATIHNLATADSYVEAIRQNIYASGDSCGRAILLGAILGASYGVGGEKGIPEEWVNKLIQKDEINELLN